MGSSCCAYILPGVNLHNRMALALERRREVTISRACDSFSASTMAQPV